MSIDMFHMGYYERPETAIRPADLVGFTNELTELTILRMRINNCKNCYGEVVNAKIKQYKKLIALENAMLNKNWLVIVGESQEEKNLCEIIQKLFYVRDTNISDIQFCTNGKVAKEDLGIFKRMKPEYKRVFMEKNIAQNAWDIKYANLNYEKFCKRVVTVEFIHKDGRVERRDLPFLLVQKYMLWTLTSALESVGNPNAKEISQDYKRLMKQIFSDVDAKSLVYLYSQLQNRYLQSGTINAINFSQRKSIHTAVNCLRNGNIIGLFLAHLNYLEKDSTKNPTFYLHEFARALNTVEKICIDEGIEFNPNPYTRQFMNDYKSKDRISPLRFILIRSLQSIIRKKHSETKTGYQLN